MRVVDAHLRRPELSLFLFRFGPMSSDSNSVSKDLSSVLSNPQPNGLPHSRGPGCAHSHRGQILHGHGRHEVDPSRNRKQPAVAVPKAHPIRKTKVPSHQLTWKLTGGSWRKKKEKKHLQTNKRTVKVFESNVQTSGFFGQLRSKEFLSHKKCRF